MMAYMWRMVSGHGPKADLEKMIELETILQALQHRMGVPPAQWFWLCLIDSIPVDNGA
eukprot:SAG25_NODE_655_length_6126_cov_12.125270_7_plen_58_part_00